jgi:hypothetical protein
VAKKLNDAFADMPGGAVFAVRVRLEEGALFVPHRSRCQPSTAEFVWKRGHIEAYQGLQHLHWLRFQGGSVRSEEAHVGQAFLWVPPSDQPARINPTTTTPIQFENARSWTSRTVFGWQRRSMVYSSGLRPDPALGLGTSASQQRQQARVPNTKKQQGPVSRNAWAPE